MGYTGDIEGRERHIERHTERLRERGERDIPRD
jgi:hypothetical protein